MADNETTTYEQIRLKNFTGSYLKTGEFIGYGSEFVDAFETHAATLLAEEDVPKLATAVDNISKMSMFPESFIQTAQIAAKDATRDKMLSAFYQYFSRICLAPESTLCAHALAIKAEVDRYKELWKGSVVEQTSYVKEFCQFLLAEANVAHTEALGLVPFITSLNTLNNEIKTLFRARNIELGRRISARDGKTIRSLRAETADIIRTLIDKVNVVYQMQPSEIPEGIMRTLRGIITKYMEIASRNKGTVPVDGEDEAPDPAPATDDDITGEDNGEGETSQVTEG